MKGFIRRNELHTIIGRQAAEIEEAKLELEYYEERLKLPGCMAPKADLAHRIDCVIDTIADQNQREQEGLRAALVSAQQRASRFDEEVRTLGTALTEALKLKPTAALGRVKAILDDHVPSTDDSIPF